MPPDPLHDSAFPHAGVPGRKRVVAREVEVENLDAARLTPASDEPVSGQILDPATLARRESRPADTATVVIEDDILSPPPGGAPRELPGETLPVVDPTILGARRRRPEHHRLYRHTQYLTLFCAALSAAAVICTMFDEPLVGRWLAGGALVPGIAAWITSGKSDLSRRWRGWAIAATVFAAVALGLTWVHEQVVDVTPPGAGSDVAPRVKK